MPYQLVHDGVVREFELFTPIGWQYWVERAFAEDGRNGLPLLIALHGGGQLPPTFAQQWPFPLLNYDSNNANWEDRFFVLYPYGFSSTPRLDGEPARGWNTGFNGLYFDGKDDVGFLRAAVGAVEGMLRAALVRAGIRRAPIDADRRFLFGYSVGGMFAYRLAHNVPDTFAALWAMSATVGGRAHEGLSATVTNEPQGSSSVSLFALHGDQDVIVPPGAVGDPTGRTQSLVGVLLHTATGLPAADAVAHADSVRHLEAAVAAYVAHNDCEPTPSSTSTTEPDIAGGTSSVRLAYRPASGAANPEVVVYRDPTLGHDGFTSSGNRYFGPAEVWDFFKAHPRVGL
jgi:poly(3-hydroxybutyrate) depolymerase